MNIPTPSRKPKTQDEQDDDEIMQTAYDKVTRCFGLRYPKDPLKRAAFLKARDIVKKAETTLETPYRDAVTILGRLIDR